MGWPIRIMIIIVVNLASLEHVERTCCGSFWSYFRGSLWGNFSVLQTPPSRSKVGETNIDRHGVDTDLVDPARYRPVSKT